MSSWGPYLNHTSMPDNIWPREANHFSPPILHSHFRGLHCLLRWPSQPQSRRWEVTWLSQSTANWVRGQPPTQGGTFTFFYGLGQPHLLMCLQKQKIKSSGNWLWKEMTEKKKVVGRARKTQNKRFLCLQKSTASFNPMAFCFLLLGSREASWLILTGYHEKSLYFV